MLERPIDFLRASLAASRADRATLGSEIDLARAYLDLLTVRMGARLRFSIDVDASCRGAVIAPMLIQPLVENAVMHGIEPKVAGGTVVVRARRIDAGLCVDVRDDGAGLVPAAPLQWIRAAQGQETRLIAIDEVIYFQSNDKYTSVVLADGEHLIRTPMRQLREQLGPQQFWQIHRSVIVAARHVAGTRTDFRGRLLVRLKGRNEQLVVSRNYADLFRQM
jgi:hypothetical protein